MFYEVVVWSVVLRFLDEGVFNFQMIWFISEDRCMGRSLAIVVTDSQVSWECVTSVTTWLLFRTPRLLAESFVVKSHGACPFDIHGE